MRMPVTRQCGHMPSGTLQASVGRFVVNAHWCAEHCPHDRIGPSEHLVGGLLESPLVERFFALLEPVE